MMILLQFSAGQGPDECCLAVAKTAQAFIKMAYQHEINVNIVEEITGSRAGTCRSLLISLEGEQANHFAETWEGTILWVAESPYRPKHGRKNWFISIQRCTPPPDDFNCALRFETMRASGPGGQHVNKTETAVRAIHIETGISVKVQSERSQYANRRLATLLIAHRLANLKQEVTEQQRAKRRLMHYQLERGNPKKIFKGSAFVCQ